jgi:DMSO/TMAO reductase YedYZ molybdopterin-dependent catalytic subunit
MTTKKPARNHDSAHDSGRRSLLKTIPALALTGAALLWGLLPSGVRAAIAERFPTRTVERPGFRFDPATGEVVHSDGRRQPYSLVLDGLVREPVRLSYAELRGLPQIRRTADFHCVEGWSVQDAPWGGVAFRELFSRVRPLPGATHAVFHSLGRTESVGGLTHYVESFPLADLRNPALNCLLALDLDGRPLTDARGAPARVVAPFDLAYKSIKFVTRVEFTDRAVAGWWTRANPIYPVDAPVQKSRLRSPDPRRG